MAIFLSGGGKNPLFDKEFESRIDKNKKLLYLPIAREPPYDSCLAWIKSIFPDLKIEMVDDASDIPKDLTQFSAVFIGGGNTFRLRDKIKTKKKNKLLKQFIKKGGNLYGGSAGAILLGQDISQSEEDKTDSQDDSGLSVLKLTIYCHYKDTSFLKVKEYSNRTKNNTLMLYDDTGVVIRGEKSFVLGHIMQR